MSQNSIAFLTAVVQKLEQAGLLVWVAGGWAEELSGFGSAREHRDIDLLFLDQDFSRLEAFFNNEVACGLELM